MSVTPVSSVVNNSNSLLDPRVAKKTLGSDDFMKLLAVQFQSQDPMKPMDDTAFIAQTAQFSSLQQTTSLVQQMTQLATAQNLATANSYLGRQVTVDLGQGKTDVGNVSGVDASTSAPMIMVNGQAYPLSAVLFVAPGAPSTIAP
jgi:flagellar basal-body rod modification protein FlgD